VLTIEKGKVEGLGVVRLHWDEVAQHVCGDEKHLIPFPNKEKWAAVSALVVGSEAWPGYLQMQCRRPDSMNIVIALARSIWGTRSPIF